MIFFPTPHIDIRFFELYRFPVTVCTCLFLCAAFIYSKPETASPLLSFTKEKRDIYWEVQGLAYYDYLIEESAQGSAHPLALQILNSSNEKSPEEIYRLIGYLSLRDQQFIDRVKWYVDQQDQVRASIWNEVQAKREGSHFERLITQYGLNYSSFSFQTVVSYIFLHASWGHLLANIIFLFVFGVVIEREFGGVFLFLLIFSGGVLGAFFYQALSGLTTISLIGASGSVSALVGFYSFFKFYEKVPYFYFMLPFENYFGVRRFPAVFIVLWWAIYELAQHYSSAGLYGSVAHSAHLGGFLIGVLLASSLRLTQNFLAHQEKTPVSLGSPS